MKSKFALSLSLCSSTNVDFIEKKMKNDCWNPCRECVEKWSAFKGEQCTKGREDYYVGFMFILYVALVIVLFPSPPIILPFSPHP